MILIHTDKYDAVAKSVSRWIEYLSEIPVMYVDDSVLHEASITLTPTDSCLNIIAGNQNVNLSDIKCSWYRRGNFRAKIANASVLKGMPQEAVAAINQYHESESQHVVRLTSRLIHDSCFGIGMISDNNLSKLDALHEAQKVGLLVPDTIITNSVLNIDKFILKHKKVILKHIQFPYFQFKDRSNYHFGKFYTELLTEDEWNQIKKFQPQDKCQFSLVQAMLDKKFEIRSFYFQREVFSMAIFSQQNPKTAIDYRNYDSERPNRNIPFHLPTEITGKIKRLMTSLNLDTGSIDLIYTPSGDFIFLEVNPSGQFYGLSKICNYYIDKYIANKLIEKHET